MQFTQAVCLSIVKIFDTKRKKARAAGLFLCIIFATLVVNQYLAISCVRECLNKRY
jgi:hypothetical protein